MKVDYIDVSKKYVLVIFKNLIYVFYPFGSLVFIMLYTCKRYVKPLRRLVPVIKRIKLFL